MPIETDLSVSPYHDDYVDTKDFYKVLFRPGVSVQARELNQMQTILQKQIERFGDNVFKQGTIISGCDITYHSVFPYVKIRDNQTDGQPVNVSSYEGYYVRNQANVTPLVAIISTTESGYESQNPDLNTLYVKYLNSGFYSNGSANVEQTTFSANQTLTVYDPRGLVEKITSYNDSAGFSNADSVVIVSALAIQNSSGGTSFANNFYAGDYIIDSTANAQIVEVDTTSNSEVVILRIKPRAIDLKAANADLWTFTVNTNIQSTNTAPSDTANVVAIIGTGATATLKTGGLGEVDLITITAKGSGYYVLPTVSISSTGATTGQIDAANLVPQTYLTNITVANSSVSPIGAGYAMSVSDGVIYQKGYFSRVEEQIVVVEKYANTPDLKVVGFETVEEIITSNQDTSLLDNATGEPNATAPGANRLRLTPTLTVWDKSDAEANSSIFTVTEFSQGNPYRQNGQTIYDVIGKEMARRTHEESGDYVLDKFILNTKSPSDFTDEDTSFVVQIDPGKAYIKGKRVETVRNYEVETNKGISTVVANNATISLNYGNYIRVTEVGGLFDFKTGDVVHLYPTAKQYITSSGPAGTTPSASGLGTTLGTARIRSMTLESGVPGTASAIYRLYLFDIRLATAKNFTLIRSIFYDGTHKGICDAVLEDNKAVLKDNNKSSLVYYAGNPAVKSVNNVSYIYRTVANTLTLATNGVISWSVAGGETFPYTGTLSSAQENDLIIVPLSNAQFSANISGSMTCNATNTQVVGTSTAFATELEAGDYLRIANSTANVVAQVNNIVNNTFLYVKSTPSAAVTSGNAAVYFPQNVPISIAHTSRTANVNTSGDTFTVYMGAGVNVATTVAVGYNVRSSNTTPVSKTVNRDQFVRLQLSNNETTNTGPWALGVSDVFRLSGVYKGANASFAVGDTGITDVTDDFYIDHNQTEDYYGTSYLYKKPNSSTTLTTSDFLLVKFAYFDDSGEGLKAPGDSGTYNIDDTLALANSSSTINTLEIPEMWGLKGDYYDLRDQFDFRPKSANTVVANTTAANAPINPTEPSNTARFGSGDKKFPAPDSSLSATIEYYQGRMTRVTVDESAAINFIDGTPGTYEAPVAPSDAVTINLIKIPPYPSIPFKMSSELLEFMDTRIANEKYTTRRLADYRISTPIDAGQREILQPRGYTMVDIGSLERRIAALEYYTQFTLTEILTQKRSIPSSSDGSTERFKFGFFVETFSDYNYSDVNNPGYRCSIIDGFLQPYSEEINLPATIGGDDLSSAVHSSLPFVEHVLVQQTSATDGAVVVANNDTTTPSNTATGNTSSNTVTSNTQVQIIQASEFRIRSTSWSASTPYVYKDYDFVMSPTSGPVGLYIAGVGQAFAFEVLKSTSGTGSWSTVVTSETAEPYETTDVYAKGNPHIGTLVRLSYGPVGNFIQDHGKISFTHNPSTGTYYKVRVYIGSRPRNEIEAHITYPINVDADYDFNVRPKNDYYVEYNGYLWAELKGIKPLSKGEHPLGYTTQDLIIANPNYQPGTADYIINDQEVLITATGLRKKTKHVVKIDGVDITVKCKQIGKLLGEDLITNEAAGDLQFVMYLDTDSAQTSSAQKAALLAFKTGKHKTIEVVSTDGLSKALSALLMPGYINEESLPAMKPNGKLPKIKLK